MQRISLSFEALKIKKSTNLTLLNVLFSIFNVFLFLVFVVSLFLIFYVLSFYMQISFVRYLAIWAGVGLSFYWVLAAIWCLYDKDDYGRGVSASDDFYNVAFTSFWLIEGFLLGLFLAYARMFDFYDPFLESDEVEASFINEDTDLSGLITLAIYASTAFIVTLSVDFLINKSSLNFFWLTSYIFALFSYFVLIFLKASVRFIEELDFEEDSEFFFDESDNVFEHEDFAEEGFDGGDYAEGYEILQLFFGYWHYTFILIHLTYLIYAFFAANGRQQHIYWAVTAIAQNVVILLLLDFLDWGEVFTMYDVVTVDTIYTWFYLSEDSTSSLYSILQDLGQIFDFVLYYFDFYEIFNFNNNSYYVLSEEELKEVILEELRSEIV